MKGKVVAITGAGRGIGLATARRFARAGALLALNDLRGGEGLEEAAATAREGGGEALLVEADVRGTGRVVTRSFSGATTRLAIALPDGLEVQADVPSADSRDLTPGTAVTVTPAERPALVEPAREDVPA